MSRGLINAMRRILGPAGAGWAEGNTDTTTSWLWQEPADPGRQVMVTETRDWAAVVEGWSGRDRILMRVPVDDVDLDRVLRTLADWHVLPDGPCALDAVDRHAVTAMAALTPDDPALDEHAGRRRLALVREES